MPLRCAVQRRPLQLCWLSRVVQNLKCHHWASHGQSVFAPSRLPKFLDQLSRLHQNAVVVFYPPQIQELPSGRPRELHLQGDGHQMSCETAAEDMRRYHGHFRLDFRAPKCRDSPIRLRLRADVRNKSSRVPLDQALRNRVRSLSKLFRRQSLRKAVNRRWSNHWQWWSNQDVFRKDANRKVCRCVQNRRQPHRQSTAHRICWVLFELHPNNLPEEESSLRCPSPAHQWMHRLFPALPPKSFFLIHQRNTAKILFRSFRLRRSNNDAGPSCAEFRQWANQRLDETNSIRSNFRRQCLNRDNHDHAKWFSFWLCCLKYSGNNAPVWFVFHWHRNRKVRNKLYAFRPAPSRGCAETIQ